MARERRYPRAAARRTRTASGRANHLPDRRVILRCLHGFGDAVQFLRYLPQLHAIAASVIVEVPPRLLPLAPCFDGITEIITWGEDAPSAPPVWDVQIEVMELPFLFRTTPAELPLATRYLRVAAAAHERGERLQVGLVGTAGVWNAARALPPCWHEHMLHVPGCEFWDLRGEDAAGTLAGLRVDPPSRSSIAALAGRIAALDLVITSDTLAAHLAGAMGVPAWVMLPFASDWRWMHATDRSPWYPSLRLFRQPAPGDWQSVIHTVAKSLTAHAAAHATEPHRL